MYSPAYDHCFFLPMSSLTPTMLNSTDIGLMPTQANHHTPQASAQPKEEPRDLSLASKSTTSIMNNNTTVSTLAASMDQPTDLSPKTTSQLMNTGAVHPPAPPPPPPPSTTPITTLAAPTQVHQDMKFLPMGPGGQLKRKRGRPRKYTMGPLPSQVASTPRSRLSLPSAFHQPAPLKSPPSQAVIPSVAPPQSAFMPEENNLSAASLPHLPVDPPMKKPRMGRPPRSSYPQNVSPAPTASPTPTVNGLTSSSPAEGKAPEAPDPTPITSALVAAAPVFPSQSTPNANAHNNGGDAGSASANKPNNNSNNNNNSVMALKQAGTLFMDYYNHPFLASPKVPSPPPPLPLHQYPDTSCLVVEGNLIGRLLPQTEAAMRAAKAAGLSGPHLWTTEMVAAFITTLPGCSSMASTFIDHVSAFIDFFEYV